MIFLVGFSIIEGYWSRRHIHAVLFESYFLDPDPGGQNDADPDPHICLKYIKKNFKSQDFNRVFETVYLVSDIRKQPISSGSATDEALSHTHGGDSVAEDIAPVKGAIKIEDGAAKELQTLFDEFEKLSINALPLF